MIKDFHMKIITAEKYYPTHPTEPSISSIRKGSKMLQIILYSLPKELLEFCYCSPEEMVLTLVEEVPLQTGCR